jgi:hypothetical protein
MRVKRTDQACYQTRASAGHPRLAAVPRGSAAGYTAWVAAIWQIHGSA